MLSYRSSLSEPKERAKYRVWLTALSMSCELFLKWLSLISIDDYKKGHRLTDCYDCLTCEVECVIDKQFLADWENGLLNPITVSGYWIEGIHSLSQDHHQQSRRTRSVDSLKSWMQLVQNFNIRLTATSSRISQVDHLWSCCRQRSRLGRS